MKTRKEEALKLSSGIFELKQRARKVDYKNVLPRMPKKPTESTMRGFHGRLGNWTKGLEYLEEQIMLQQTVRRDETLQVNGLFVA